MGIPTSPRGNLVTPVAYDPDGALKPLLVDADGALITSVGGGSSFVPSLAIVHEQQANNTAGGTFTSGAWQTRTLNTVVFDPDSIVSISSNQFTLGSGKYLIEWWAPASTVANHKSRLYDVTGSSVINYGQNAYSGSASPYAATISPGSAYVAVAVTNTYRIEHRCQTTAATNGYGGASNFGTIEVYTIVKILRIGD